MYIIIYTKIDKVLSANEVELYEDVGWESKCGLES